MGDIAWTSWLGFEVSWWDVALVVLFLMALGVIMLWDDLQRLIDWRRRSDDQ